MDRAGRRVVGRKAGLTAKAVQTQLGVDQRDFGTLSDDMEVPDHGELLVSRVLQPKAEAEIAFIMGAALESQSPTPDEVAAAVHSIATGIGIVESRIADWRISFSDNVADNGSSAFFVLGRDRTPLAGLDQAACSMVMEVDNSVASIGAGTSCLGHPLNAAAWLARTLAERGDPLRAGDIVLTGAPRPMVTISPGNTVSAAIGGQGTASFALRDDRS